jgi:hypothetical protein
MVFTAGLLNRLRWRCILAAGDLSAAAAAHDRQITATSRRAVSMGGAWSRLYRSPLLVSSPVAPSAAGDVAAKAPLLRQGPPRRRLPPRTDSKKIQTVRGARCEGAMAPRLGARSSPRLGLVTWERSGHYRFQAGSEA